MRVVKLLKPIIDIAIPSDVISEAPDEREAIRKIGLIGRGAGIFQVSKIIIYKHALAGGNDRSELISRNLQYLSTPPYLRKDLFKLSRELRLAGLLPPLKTPNHASEGRPERGEFRDGVVIRWDGYYSIVKIGDGVYAKVPRPMPLGTRVVVQIEAPTNREDTYRAHVVPRDKLGIYWGFDVAVMSLRELLTSGAYDSVVFTGREGEDISNAMERVINALRTERLLVVFGSPRNGVDEILRAEGLEDLLGKHPFINFIPGQGVETVRTEEAVIAVLSILNLLRSLGTKPSHRT
ncbi:putative RNA uridine N3 methyltransferase [Vulcanisaeta thermophila]|uniref:putative RNA uridine N3 methyltransferase n=1 Tax=Vulcanisaeta thermophila TaxID=867917 RepID=UPI000852DDBB|nr:putative RNA uridine N3 methyltransferase [Vulcanisaeta thermophila]